MTPSCVGPLGLSSMLSWEAATWCDALPPPAGPPVILSISQSPEVRLRDTRLSPLPRTTLHRSPVWHNLLLFLSRGQRGGLSVFLSSLLLCSSFLSTVSAFSPSSSHSSSLPLSVLVIPAVATPRRPPVPVSSAPPATVRAARCTAPLPLSTHRHDELPQDKVLPSPLFFHFFILDVLVSLSLCRRLCPATNESSCLAPPISSTTSCAGIGSASQSTLELRPAALRSGRSSLLARPLHATISPTGFLWGKGGGGGGGGVEFFF